MQLWGWTVGTAQRLACDIGPRVLPSGLRAHRDPVNSAMDGPRRELTVSACALTAYRRYTVAVPGKSALFSQTPIRATLLPDAPSRAPDSSLPQSTRIVRRERANESTHWRSSWLLWGLLFSSLVDVLSGAGCLGDPDGYTGVCGHVYIASHFLPHNQNEALSHPVSTLPPLSTALQHSYWI